MFINYIQIYKNPVKLLETIDTWLQSEFSKLKLALIFIFNFSCIGIFTFLQTAELFQAQDIDDFSEILSALPVFAGIIVKALNFLANKKQINSCLEFMSEIIKHKSWIRNQNGSKMEKQIQKISKIYKVMFCALIISCSFGFVDPFLFDGYIYKMWLPIDYKSNWLVHLIFIIYQLINCFVYVPLWNVLNFFPLFLISYAVGMTDELCDKLENVTSDRKKRLQPKPGNSRHLETIEENDDFQTEELKKCIEIQLKIKEFVKLITANFAKIFWMQGFLSTLTLCTNSFSMTKVRKYLK
jgi:hypothetical protein